MCISIPVPVSLVAGLKLIDFVKTIDVSLWRRAQYSPGIQGEDNQQQFHFQPQYLYKSSYFNR